MWVTATPAMFWTFSGDKVKSKSKTSLQMQERIFSCNPINFERKFSNSLEGMTLRSLLNCWHDGLVDFERDGSDESQERNICKDADEGEHGHGKKDGESDTEHNSWLLDIAPVDQWLHCERKKKKSISNFDTSSKRFHFVQQWLFVGDKRCGVIESRRCIHVPPPVHFYKARKRIHTWTTLWQILLVSIAVLISSHRTSTHFGFYSTPRERRKVEIVAFSTNETELSETFATIERRSVFVAMSNLERNLLVLFSFLLLSWSKKSKAIEGLTCSRWMCVLNEKWENNESEFLSLSLDSFYALIQAVGCCCKKRSASKGRRFGRKKRT